MTVGKKRKRLQQAQLRYLEVVARPNESPEQMIKRFTKKVRGDGVLQELYLRRAYEKPSQKRRRKHARALFNKFNV